MSFYNSKRSQVDQFYRYLISNDFLDSSRLNQIFEEGLMLYITGEMYKRKLRNFWYSHIVVRNLDVNSKATLFSTFRHYCLSIGEEDETSMILGLMRKSLVQDIDINSFMGLKEIRVMTTKEIHESKEEEKPKTVCLYDNSWETFVSIYKSPTSKRYFVETRTITGHTLCGNYSEIVEFQTSRLSDIRGLREITEDCKRGSLNRERLAFLPN